MNGGDPVPDSDLERARELALRYRCKFVNLHDFKLPFELLRKVPVTLMFRYNFVPLAEMQDGRIAIAAADPCQLMLFDEISSLLGKPIVVHVATLAQISKVLNRGGEGPSQIADGAPEGTAWPQWSRRACRCSSQVQTAPPLRCCKGRSRARAVAILS
jgi:hypothetical protein